MTDRWLPILIARDGASFVLLKFAFRSIVVADGILLTPLGGERVRRPDLVFQEGLGNALSGSSGDFPTWVPSSSSVLSDFDGLQVFSWAESVERNPVRGRTEWRTGAIDGA